MDAADFEGKIRSNLDLLDYLTSCVGFRDGQYPGQTVNIRKVHASTPIASSHSLHNQVGISVTARCPNACFYLGNPINKSISSHIL
jgi:hypothetical protein